jgi:hypothetical protein
MDFGIPLGTDVKKSPYIRVIADSHGAQETAAVAGLQRTIPGRGCLI